MEDVFNNLKRVVLVDFTNQMMNTIFRFQKATFFERVLITLFGLLGLFNKGKRRISYFTDFQDFLIFKDSMDFYEILEISRILPDF
jgi:hypothetical protein